MRQIRRSIWNVLREDMKKINKVMLFALLIATICFFISEFVAGWFDWEHGKELVLIPYTIAYFVGFVFAVVGIPVSLIGLARSRGDRRSTAISGLNCLASLAFLALLFIWPFIKHNVIGKSEAVKHHQQEGTTEQSDPANGATSPR